MLNIIPKTKDSCRSLHHDKDVFHKALKYVMRGGEQKFHIRNQEGEDYDLVYTCNNDLYSKLPQARNMTVVPPYLIYDETKSNSLYTKLLEGFSSIIFEEVDEYTIVLAKSLLKLTELTVYFNDAKILWFIEPCERLIITETLPEKTSVNGFLCCRELCIGEMQGFRDQMCSSCLFHNVFIFQWMTDLPFDQIRNVEITLPYLVGIGGLLSYMTRVSEAFKSYGFRVLLQADSTRFGDKMISKYFNVSIGDENCTEENTMFLPNLTPLMISHFLNQFKPNLNVDIINESFREEMETYREAVLGDKKYLGILIRGTDYISTQKPGEIRHATVDDMLPLIREWMAEDRYDGIFLATEDQDVLESMLKEFPGKIRAIAQERHRVSDFKENQLICELEEQEKSGQAYIEALEDTTVNYFLALYMLSKCDSYMVSGPCNGWSTVLALNEGKFNKTYMFQLRL